MLNINSEVKEYIGKNSMITSKMNKEDRKFMAMKFYAVPDAPNPNKSTIYRGIPEKDDVPPRDTNIDFVISDTVSTLSLYPNRKVGLLNYASYKNPGGKFLEGSKAQEEDLCLLSSLYKHLEQQKQFYAMNRTDLNRGLYRNVGITTRDVMFYPEFFHAPVPATVFTVPAPNWGAARRNNVSYGANLTAMCDRIELLLVMAEKAKVDTLVAGAWGCGVFKQNIEDVARCFCRVLASMNLSYDIVFAIPDADSLNKFKRAFEDYYQTYYK